MRTVSLCYLSLLEIVRTVMSKNNEGSAIEEDRKLTNFNKNICDSALMMSLQGKIQNQLNNGKIDSLKQNATAQK